jgi:hypothetical protein
MACPAGTPGLSCQADDPPDLVGQTERCSVAEGGAVIGLQGLPEPDDAGRGVAGLAQARQMLLGERAGVPVAAQDRPEIPSGLAAGRRG